MLVLEIDFGPDTETNDVLLLYTQDQLDKKIESPTKTFLSISGPYEWLRKLLHHVASHPIPISNVLYFGKVFNSVDFKLSVYAMLAVSAESWKFQLLQIASGTIITRHLGSNCWDSCDATLQFFYRLQQACVQGDFAQVYFAVESVKEISEKMYPTLAAAFDKALSHAYKLVELERILANGIETQDLKSVLARSYLKDLSRSFGKSLIGYSSLINYTSPQTKNRIEFVRAASQLSQDLLRSLANSDMPRLLTLFSAYFLYLSKLHGQRREYSVAVSYIMRAIESYCQGILLFVGIADFDNRGNLTLYGKKSKGFAEVIQIAEQEMNLALCASSRLWPFLELRNKSTCGHGISYPSKQMFNDAYAAARDVISKHERSYTPSPFVFLQLLNYVETNAFKGLEVSVAKQVLELLALRPEIASSI
jgi:hypothetical protein